MTAPDPPPAKPPKETASVPGKGPVSSDLLPPVQAPDASFILQLFLIPMLIVMIIVLVWLGFSWLAHAGSDPNRLVQGIRDVNDASWQKAFALSNLLRNPEHDQLKDDAELAGELAQILQEQLAAKRMDEERVSLRIYLCRTLGEFRVPAGIPALVEAAELEREAAEVAVRRTALEALALAVNNVGESARTDAGIERVLLAAARESGAGPEEKVIRGDLRSTAAFALGVLGTPPALDELEQLLSDPYPNARYNAATGLARNRDPRAVPVLVEMLDPENPAVVEGEVQVAQERKRMEVITNAIRASESLLDGPDAAIAPLRTALQDLAESSQLPRAARLAAAETLRRAATP